MKTVILLNYVCVLAVVVLHVILCVFSLKFKGKVILCNSYFK
jgi:hypothetical protein